MTTVLIVGAVAMLALLGIAILVVPRFDFSSHRRHLAPIPISHAACPGVAAMHDAAGRYADAYPFGSSLDASGNTVAWPKVRDELARSSQELENAVDLTMPLLPRRVGHYLAITRQNIENGRTQLLLARDSGDLLVRTDRFEADGQQAFGYAGDLIGRQCGIPLGV